MTVQEVFTGLYALSDTLTPRAEQMRLKGIALVLNAVWLADEHGEIATAKRLIAKAEKILNELNAA